MILFIWFSEDNLVCRFANSFEQEAVVSVSSAFGGEMSFFNIPDLRTLIMFLSEEKLSCREGATGMQRVGSERPA